MERLGYDRWAAQGGNWGAAVTTAIGHKAPRGLAGLHLTFVMFQPAPDEVAEATPAERRFARLVHFGELPRGGHFAALEQPELFVEELRATFSGLRT